MISVVKLFLWSEFIVRQIYQNVLVPRTRKVLYKDPYTRKIIWIVSVWFPCTLKLVNIVQYRVKPHCVSLLPQKTVPHSFPRKRFSSLIHEKKDKSCNCTWLPDFHSFLSSLAVHNNLAPRIFVFHASFSTLWISTLLIPHFVFLQR